jgi:hypothetical protein
LLQSSNIRAPPGGVSITALPIAEVRPRVKLGKACFLSGVGQSNRNY